MQTASVEIMRRLHTRREKRAAQCVVHHTFALVLLAIGGAIIHILYQKRVMRCHYLVSKTKPVLRSDLPTGKVHSSNSSNTANASNSIGRAGGHPTMKSHTEPKRPLLEELTNQTLILGDVQFLLDFVHVGFHKTCSTTVRFWLDSCPDVAMLPGEPTALNQNRTHKLVRALYQSLPANASLRRGYTNPGTLASRNGLAILLRHFPRTKLIVGVRHPVFWYQSFHNFYLKLKLRMPDGLLQNDCHSLYQGNCYWQAPFHAYIARLGKTKVLNDSAELALFDIGHDAGGQRQGDRALRKVLNTMTLPMPNPVFFYETGQISDNNVTRAKQFRVDLQRFLDLPTALPVPPLENQNRKQEINICDAEYDRLRARLMVHARQASQWLRAYFLASPDVHVSSREHVSELLAEWMNDPCAIQREIELT